MFNIRPTRTVLVLLGLLVVLSPLEAKKNKLSPTKKAAATRPDETPPGPEAQAEVPSDLPSTADLPAIPETREPARVGPGLTDEAVPTNADLIPGPPPEEAPAGQPVKLLDADAESALDTPADRNASSESAPETNPPPATGEAKAAAAVATAPSGLTEEEVRAEERLKEMQVEQERAKETEKENERLNQAEEEAQASNPEEDAARAAALAAVKEEEKAEATARSKKQTLRKTAQADEGDGSTLSHSAHKYDWQSPRHFGLDLQFAPVRYPNLALDSVGTIGGNLGNGARLNFEWMFFQLAGKAALGIGLHFSAIPAAVNAGGETIVINALGGEVGLTYRADFIDHQILVPFARFGIDVDYVVQSRENGSTASQGTYQGTLYGGGLELCLFFLERRNARLLDRKFGINETFIVFEYLKTANAKTGNAPDLSHDEFRIGLRFEI